MDMKHIDEHLLVERYLQGALTEEEAEAFEELYLSSPELLDQLEAGEKLQQGMQDLAALKSAATDPLAAGPDVETRKSARHLGAAAVFGSPRYAMAATVFLAISLVVTGTLTLTNSELSKRNNELMNQVQTSAGVSAQIIPLFTVRGSNDARYNTVSPDDRSTAVVLMVDPGMEPYEQYRASVFHLEPGQSATSLFQMEGLKKGYLDSLALSLPAAALTAGNYEVIVEGSHEAGQNAASFEHITRIPFRVE